MVTERLEMRRMPLCSGNISGTFLLLRHTPGQMRFLAAACFFLVPLAVLLCFSAQAAHIPALLQAGNAPEQASRPVSAVAPDCVSSTGAASVSGLADAVDSARPAVAADERRAAAGGALFSSPMAGAAAAPGKAAAPALLLARQAGGLQEAIPVPPGLFKKGVSPQSAADEILQSFLGIAYRTDGVVSACGDYTLFADPAKRFPTPGLNCSGLVLEASRLLLKKNYSLKQAGRDRLGDSGPDSPYGKDWDFGWDLIMNISEGFPRTLLLPGHDVHDFADATGFSPRGYDIHKAETWRELPDRLRPGHLYLFSLSVEGRRRRHGLKHYHVGLIHVARDGKAWLYQTTGRGKAVNRRDICGVQGRKSFQDAFATTGPAKRMMLVLEVALPDGE